MQHQKQTHNSQRKRGPTISENEPKKSHNFAVHSALKIGIKYNEKIFFKFQTLIIMKWNKQRYHAFFRFSNFFDLVSFLFQSSMMPYLKMTKLEILNQCDISKFFILFCVFILGEILIHCVCLHHQERIGVEGRKIHAFHLQKRITQTHKTFGLQKTYIIPPPPSHTQVFLIR